MIKIGDHIERINDKNLVGSRHFEVAKLLKEIPVGTTFTLKLVEPTREGFRKFGLSKPLKKKEQNKNKVK